ncbi:MAG: NERD domain-containing protein [Kiritimatiellales bacterium]|nr:NERD domain-containing protein [Kiritimatiellales bacterium]
MNKPLNSSSSSFARVYGSPGEAPRVLGLLRAFWPLLLICLLTGYLVRALCPWPVLGLSMVGILFFLVAVVTGILLVWGGRRLGNFLKGAKGEEWVAHELAFLPSQCTVFNGLRLSGGQSNFDHIVVGPSGIYVVETKNWRGTVDFREGKLYCDGREPSRPPLRQVKAATAELLEYLDRAGIRGLTVHSLLCFISTTLPEDVMNVNGVVVCTGAKLFDVLQENLAEALPTSRCHEVVEELKKAIGSAEDIAEATE